MISIVLVSHSETLAEGVAELAQQMVQGQVAMATAGGTTIPEQPIGTDPIKVYTAIESVYSDDGVLILMDLGSAIMSAEAAIEFFGPDQQERIFLCEGPLVEGALAAAVAAMGGDSIEQVFAEVRTALGAKTEQLLPLLRIPPDPAPTDDQSKQRVPSPAALSEDDEARFLSVTIPNRLGIHARPAARLAGLSRQFDARATVTKGGTKGERTVSIRSMNGLVTLGARQGDTVMFQASGADAEQMLRAIQELADDNFGDVDTQTSNTRAPEKAEDDSSSSHGSGQGTGIPVVPGIAVGPVFFSHVNLPTLTPTPVEDVRAERERLEEAVAHAVAELVQLEARIVQRANPAEAAIFEAHRYMLEDEALLDSVRQRIRQDAINAEAAWMISVEALAEEYRQTDDAYIAGRAVDVLDVGRRVLYLLDHNLPRFTLPSEPSILIVNEITPGEAAQLDPEKVLGVLTSQGGATDHSAILLASLGIPSIFGLKNQLSAVKPGQVVGLDGRSGEIWLSPTEAEQAELRQAQTAWLEQWAAMVHAAQKPARTQDGYPIPVLANITGMADVTRALDAGAEGVGLFRTEFLYMDRLQPPTEEEQVQIYRDVLTTLKGRPLVVRTLDAGGDKPVAYLNLPAEANPFLGLRGIRYSLSHLPLFKTQLRALLRAGGQADSPIQLMLPMVSSLEEVQTARQLLTEVQTELTGESHPLPPDLALGIMVEVPAAVSLAPELARIVDFFSIGTNDLGQYVMAADRTNPAVAALADARQVAVLRMVAQTIEAARSAGIKVSVCGALAGDPSAVPTLLGLGVNELSVAAPAIGPVKQAVRQLSLAQAREEALQAIG